MKKTLFPILLFLLSACASADTMTPLDPLAPHNTLEGTTPTTHTNGAPITDLTSINHDCGGVPFSTAITTLGTAFVEPLPAGVLALTGAVTCTSIAVSAGGETSLPSNPTNRWVEGGNAYDSQPAACDGSGCYATAPAHCEPGVGCFAAVPVYCEGGACFDEARLNPPALGDGGGQAGGGTSALALAAAALLPGESVAITPNTLQNSHDVQWQTATVYRDAARELVRYLGKPATNQPGGDIYSLHTYDEATDAWSSQVASTGQIGHAWTVTFDHDTGDYYYHINGSTSLERYVAATGQWVTTAAQTNPSLISGGANLAAMGYHPNLFGQGQPGIFAWSIFRAFAYNPATDTWTNLSPTSFASGTPYFNRSIGQALYLPGSDRLIMFSKNTSGLNEAILVEAGAGANADPLAAGLIHLTGAPPLNVYGGGGVDNQGHVVNVPGAPDSMLLLEEHGTSRVWRSDDSGATWVLQAYTHPFQDMPALDSGEYTVGALDAFGVIAAATSSPTGGEFRIWKPGV